MSLLVAICDDTGRIVQAMHSVHDSLDDLAHAAEFPIAEGWTVVTLDPALDATAAARWDAIRRSLHRGRTLADLRAHCPILEELTIPALGTAAEGRHHRVIAGLKAIIDAPIIDAEADAIPEDLAAVAPRRPEEFPELVALLPGSRLLADLGGQAERGEE